MAFHSGTLKTHCSLFQIPQEHIGHVQAVLTLLRNAEATLTLKIYLIFTKVNDYLKHVIRPRRSGIASYTTEAIRRLKEPTNITKLSFMKLCNVLRRFVLTFARLAAPLNAKPRKHQPTLFGPLIEDELKSMNLPKKLR